MPVHKTARSGLAEKGGGGEKGGRRDRTRGLLVAEGEEVGGGGRGRRQDERRDRGGVVLGEEGGAEGAGEDPLPAGSQGHAQLGRPSPPLLPGCMPLPSLIHRLSVSPVLFRFPFLSEKIFLQILLNLASTFPDAVCNGDR